MVPIHNYQATNADAKNMTLAPNLNKGKFVQLENISCKQNRNQPASTMKNRCDIKKCLYAMKVYLQS